MSLKDQRDERERAKLRRIRDLLSRLDDVYEAPVIVKHADELTPAERTRYGFPPNG